MMSMPNSPKSVRICDSTNNDSQTTNDAVVGRGIDLLAEASALEFEQKFATADSSAVDETVEEPPLTPTSEIADGGNQQLFVENGQLYCEDNCPDSSIEDLNENDRALQLLIEATSMFRSVLRGAVLTARPDALRDISELTGVPATIIYYAYRHGVLRAHKMYLKKEFKPEDINEEEV